MKLHIKLGKAVLKSLEDSGNNVKIYKLPYLIGCIAPDINGVCPFHTIEFTSKRLEKKLNSLCKRNSVLLRSFIYGLITHYTCDYFCLAHNNESYGFKHRQYETSMSRGIKSHKLKIEKSDTFEDIKTDKFEDIKSEINGYINKTYTKVLDYISDMNKCYTELFVKHCSKLWYTDLKQMQIDLNWALFMSSEVGRLVYVK